MLAEIIAVGSEMLTPYRQDTNSLYLTAGLNDLGVSVAFKTIVGDNHKRLASAIRVALNRADILLLSGGLGPTEDDLTRECLAEALHLKLHRDYGLLESLNRRFAGRDIAMPANNARQADVLDGATLLPNPNGTAPGQWLDTVFNLVSAEMGDDVFSVNGESLEEVVLLELGLRNQTVSVAESCTGGWLGERLTAVPNSSKAFLGGAIVYTDRSKIALGDVPSFLIEEHGAVSDPVARALAEGIRRRTGSTLGLSITGIAGPANPEGRDAAKPVGLVYIALTDGEETEVKQLHIPGDRERVRLWATQHALEMLRRHLQ